MSRRWIDENSPYSDAEVREIVKLKFFEKRSPDRVSARSPWRGFVMIGR
jgi:hypothetical protein